MTDADVPEWLEDEIRNDYYQWRPLQEVWGKRVAELRFPLEEKAEVEALAQEARELGLDAHVGQLDFLSDQTRDLINLAVYVGKLAGSTYAFLKIVNDGPTQAQAFIKKLLSLRRSKDSHPALQLDAVNAWLNTKFGPRGWRYDPDAVQVKQRTPGGPTVLALTEETRNRQVLLLVGGDSVKELPSEWGPVPKTADA